MDPIKENTIEDVLVEWSYRTSRGFPKINKLEDRNILKNILREWYGPEVASQLLENLEGVLDEVALGLNNSSLRHKNEHKKYNKKLIDIFRSGGEVVIEKAVSYTDESEDDTSEITIPAKESVEVDSGDEIIGKLVAALRGIVKYGPDFPDDSEKAQKALRFAEKVFTHDDGSYKRVVPILYKNRKILVKLNDLSKDTVTEREPEEDEAGSEASKEQPDQSKQKKRQQKKSDESPDNKKSSQNDSGDQDDQQNSVDEQVEEDDESHDYSKMSEVAFMKHLTYENSEELEDERMVNEDDDDKPSKYADRRDDGKDDVHPDRPYSDEDEGAAASDDEESEDSDQDAEENDEEEVEESMSVSELQKVMEKINKFANVTIQTK